MELEVLGDRYELQEPIGRGGMATIYRAVDLRMGRTVAVKILREVYSSDPKFVTRFQREARAASALQHPNIVQVFDYGQSGDSYYIAMEFIEGADLRRYLKKHGMLSNERAIEIAHDVALGLGAAHKRGIVHRDVKPQNVMLNDDGLVKLTDFGIASVYKDVDAERLTTTGMTLGTVQYYAPEQAQGEVVSPAADIYALGIVMYEMLAGKTPFDGDTPVAVAMRHIQDIPEPPSRINPRISPALERIILRCLEKDPRDRYRDGDALAYALENVSRAPARRGASAMTGSPLSRPQFAPLGLPSTDARPQPGAGPAVYGGPAIMNGPSRPPRGVVSQPRPPVRGGPGTQQQQPYGGYDDVSPYEPTYNGLGDTLGGPDAGISTRPWGPAPGTLPRSPSTGRPSSPYEAQRRRGNGPLVAVIVSAAVLLLGLTCFLIASLTGMFSGIGLFNQQTPTPVATTALTTVPNFVGLQIDKAQAQAADNHLKVVITFTADSSAKNTVLKQDPPANKSVPWDTQVDLTVSNGPDKVKVPDVTNLELSDARAKLKEANLTQVNVVTQQDPTVPAGHVIKTDPPAGALVLPDQTITLVVSTGAPTPTPAPTATAAPKPTATATATATCTPVAPPPLPTPAPPPCP
jgi:eukaryotic-like serine/threonine-protein kinase